MSENAQVRFVGGPEDGKTHDVELPLQDVIRFAPIHRLFPWMLSDDSDPPICVYERVGDWTYKYKGTE